MGRRRGRGCPRCLQLVGDERCDDHRKKSKKGKTRGASGVQAALRRAEEQDFRAYKAELRRLERSAAAEADPDEDFSTMIGQLRRSDAGYPLGPLMPRGASLREDGESHRAAWMRVVRDDPCAYCGERRGGTVDHIEPQNGPNRGDSGDVHSWLNYTSACASCNVHKGAEKLLLFLRKRGGVRRMPNRAPVAEAA